MSTIQNQSTPWRPDPQDAMALRAVETQTMALTNQHAPWILDGALFAIQCLAWTLAVGAIALAVSLFTWESREVEPFAITQSGFVVALVPLDAARLEQILSRPGGAQ